MSWTVIKEDADGNPIKSLKTELVLSNTDILYGDNFKLLKYLDPYGDTTYNTYMLTDLISDLTALKGQLPVDQAQIEEVIQLAEECQEEVHTFLKFYGD